MKIKDQNRCNEIIEYYRLGETLEEIGTKLGLTRERVRQLIKKGIQYSVIQAKSKLEYDKSLRSLNLSDRAINGLARNNIFTFSDLEGISENDLFHLRGIGNKSSKEIIQRAKEVGINLKGQQSLFKNNVGSTPIDILGLSPRAVNVLVRSNVLTTEQLYSMSPLEIESIPGLGGISSKEIIDIVVSHRESEEVSKSRNIEKETPIETLILEPRSLNALRRNHIYYIESLLEYSKEELSSLQSFGNIVLEHIIKELERNGYKLNQESLSEKIEDEFNKLKEEHRNNKLVTKVGTDLDVKEKELLEIASWSSSEVEFLQNSNITATILHELFPNVLKVVLDNQRKKQLKWSRYYIKCLDCGTTITPHRANGLCEKCYPKSDYFKQIQKNSHQKHKEKRKEQLSAYAKEYAKRPEAIEKNRISNDIKKFGGNREKAIDKFNNKCSLCSTSRIEAEKKWGKDFCVIHVDGDNENNSIENLVPFCYGCFMKQPKGSGRKHL